ncbi:uncharacterized protein LOC131684297 [Topomyia yanbarensis]|uniref:uncharacterized protein LOC131684297 n=1 Tax=Topomyia yanbarensis TaxID=2498891 RepID=UPI00273C0EEA|nr:uncharacterized protein LOC131684297 [Topomyia yanbarensis]XP_058823014.1 uncharacterized protein LOC131684297 [Topomyia yanbarensis]XP_058823015.1 uncharacterized protein LOC131684297 [Topomyia yanbarensis]
MSSNIENMTTQSAIYRVNTESTLFEFVSEQKNALAASIASLPVEEASKQIELALTFMKYYMEQEDDGLLDEPTAIHRVVIDTRKSVFEILLDLHSSMRATCVGFSLYFTGEDASKDAFVRKLLEFPNFDTGAKDLNIPKLSFDVSYCTMVVFDSSDLESATDVLAKAWVNCSVPWVIRSILVQETAQEKFIALMENKLKPFADNVPFERELRDAVNKASKTGLRLIQNPTDSKDLKPTVVYGSSVDFFLEKGSPQPSPVVVLNVFRTAKEAISLANKDNGGSVSLWTEELSLAFETAYAVTAQSVWVNSYATFNPAFPYTFRRNDFCYGSKYAICEKKVKTVFVPSPENPVNSVEKNKAAIGSLGVIPSEVTEQRYSFVRNEKNIHYEMVSLPYKIENFNAENHMQIVDKFWDMFITIDMADRNLVLDTVYNQRKTVVIPYGVSFAN